MLPDYYLRILYIHYYYDLYDQKLIIRKGVKEMDFIKGLARARACMFNLEKEVKNVRNFYVRNYNRGYDAMDRTINRAESLKNTLQDKSWLSDLKGFDNKDKK